MTHTVNNNQRTDLKNGERFSSSLSESNLPSRTDLVEEGEVRALLISKIDDYDIALEADSSCDLVYLPDVSLDKGKEFKDRPRARARVELRGGNSRINVFLPIILTGTDELNIDLVCRHIGKNSQVFVYLMSAVSDKAKLDFTGNLIVDPEAQGSKTHLSGKAILLSDTAKARILPALEIKSDDVEASHKATVGEVDLGQKFYLESRGIPSGKAENMIIRGNFDYIISALNNDEQKIYVKEYINNKLSLDG